MKRSMRSSPNWDTLYATASRQAGYFTTLQAGNAGYSSQLLYKSLKNGRILRVKRGIYRIVHFPDHDNEDLIVHWLWSEMKGVFSHDTALFLHQLSDVMASGIHMTLPLTWKRRRLRIPRGLILVFEDLTHIDKGWFVSVPVTSPARTVNDCAKASVSPELVEQAIRTGLDRGLFLEEDISDALEYVRRFSGRKKGS